jgi:hypothetical protein
MASVLLMRKLRTVPFVHILRTYKHTAEVEQEAQAARLQNAYQERRRIQRALWC